MTPAMLRQVTTWLLACSFVLSGTGCVLIPQRDPLPAELMNVAQPLGQPNFRSWGDEVSAQAKEIFAADADTIAQKYPAIVGRPHHYLAISGGGANGAFGAGLLVGWSDRGDRPDFTMVTGVSTGALAAPFVFLGSDYDDVLEELYTTISTADILKKRGIISRFFSDSIMESEPLKALLERHIDEALMQAIAAESEKGRILLISTTHLDAGRPVVWNIGNIARSGHPDALNLIRQVLLASASIPAIFPPVLIDVEAGERNYDELHVDGGVAAQVFFYHAGIMWNQVLEKFDVPGVPSMYIIRNSQLGARWMQVTNKALPIAGRSVATLIRRQGTDDLHRIYLLARRDGVDFNLAYIPGEFSATQSETFDPEYMRNLFDLGYRMAKQGYPWSKAPPEIGDLGDLISP